jgi:uncharacterized protein (TIGR02118 family)
MIKVSVMYLNEAGKTFDIDYYRDKHMPLVQVRVGAALKRISVLKGIAGGTPGSPPPYLAIGELSFESTDTFKAAFGPQAKTIMADVPNFTNATPVAQISEVSI